MKKPCKAISEKAVTVWPAVIALASFALRPERIHGLFRNYLSLLSPVFHLINDYSPVVPHMICLSAQSPGFSYY